MSNKIINKNNKSDTQLIKKNFEGQSNFNSIINRRSASQLSQLVLTNKLVNSINQSSFNYNLGQNEDVPDSPFAKSSTTSSAYFSDNAETEAQYISRKTVQNILTAQRQLPVSNIELEKNKNVNKYPQQRNSSSSIDSLQDQSHILNYKKEYNLTSLSETDALTNINFSAKAQILNQKLLLSNNENINGQSLKQTLSAKENTNSKIVLPFRKELKSTDAGYDSYSLSSSDSYPSIGGSAVTAVGSIASSSGCSSASSNDKKLSLNNTLRSINEQIISNNESLPINQNNNSLPAEQQLLNLINENKMQDCDKLCSESDILLLRSHEKERESDLKAAAILSEDAAQKARAAMDAPYSNSHALISAKMKHSMCVMRSAALHRRIKELELEEKKKLKNIENNHHSRQSSRDSLSRQFKRNSLDKLNKLNDSLQQNLTSNNNQQSERNNYSTTKAVQLYCTLPKKPSSTSSLVQTNKNSEEQDYQNLNVVKNQLQQQIPQQLLSSSVVKVKSKNMLNRNTSSCSTSSNTSNNTKDLDSSINDNYSEIGDYVSSVKNSNKQHKIRKKLLIGNFIKRKNKSLPDLRDNKTTNPEVEIKEDSKTKSEDVVDTTLLPKKESTNPNNPKVSEKPIVNLTPDKQNVAKVSRKGFHPVFDNQNALSSSSSIKLVNPPVLNNCQTASVKNFKNQQVLNKSHSTNDFSKPILQELNAPPKAILPSPSLKNNSIKNCNNSDVSIKNQTESQSLIKNSNSQNFNSSNNESNIKTLTPPLPPVNEKEIINLKISVETSDELPPPPDHFLEDLREKRLIEKQLTEKNNQEQLSNLINENIENEIKEIKLQMSYNNLNKPPVISSPNNNRAAVRNLTTKFEKLTTLSNDNKPQILSNKPPLPLVENHKKQIDSNSYDVVDSNLKLGTSQKSGLRVAVLGLKNQPAQGSRIWTSDVKDVWVCATVVKKFERGDKELEVKDEKGNHQSAIIIQKHWRAHLVRKAYNKKLKQIIVVQSLIRKWLAKKVFKQLKIEARSIDHVKTLNRGLESKIIQLQQKIEFLKTEITKTRQLENENQEIKTEKAKLLSDIRNLKNIIIGKNKEVDYLKVQTEQEKEKNVQIETKLDEIKFNYEELKNKLSQFDKSYNKKVLEEQLAEREKIIQSKFEKEKKALLLERESEKSAHQQLLRKYAALEDKLLHNGEISDDFESRRPDISTVSLMMRCSELEQEKAKLKHENEEMRSAFANSIDENGTNSAAKVLAQHYSSLQNELDKIREERKHLKTIVLGQDSLKEPMVESEVISAFKSIINQLETELESQKDSNEQYKSELENFKKGNDKKDQVVSSTTTDIVLNANEEHVMKLNQEKILLKQKCKALIEENNKLRLEVLRRNVVGVGNENYYVGESKDSVNQNYLGMFEFAQKNTPLITKILITNLEPSDALKFPAHYLAYIMFMCIRYTDYINDETQVKTLLNEIISCLRRRARSTNSVEVLSLWLANVCCLLTCLKQFSGDEYFGVLDESLRSFDLFEYRQIFNDAIVHLVHNFLRLSEEKIQPLIVPAILEYEGLATSGICSQPSNLSRLGSLSSEQDGRDSPIEKPVSLMLKELSELYKFNSSGSSLMMPYFMLSHVLNI
ncbi:hypothetical protein RND71_044126 [Anisodus tanguticus]|uniref:Dilute domain-containing protein n=1 Tax=Anisodus tanguticus TaxID=243964 RepID=A0AAE1QP78_9SOLA|nr:hypothetical protein RND71_044126 [Anisodus tanguticus]